MKNLYSQSLSKLQYINVFDNDCISETLAQSLTPTFGCGANVPFLLYLKPYKKEESSHDRITKIYTEYNYIYSYKNVIII